MIIRCTFAGPLGETGPTFCLTAELSGIRPCLFPFADEDAGGGVGGIRVAFTGRKCGLRISGIPVSKRQGPFGIFRVPDSMRRDGFRIFRGRFSMCQRYFGVFRMAFSKRREAFGVFGMGVSSAA